MFITYKPETDTYECQYTFWMHKEQIESELASSVAHYFYFLLLNEFEEASNYFGE